MKTLWLGLSVLVLAATGYAISVNPASNVLGDSDATQFTIPYRNTNGMFRIAPLTTAQIQALTPDAAGYLVYNTTLKEICVSTGTTIQAFQIVGSTVAATLVRGCQ